MMRCIGIENEEIKKPKDFDDIINKIENLKYIDIEKPNINSNQILIKVYATSITADELIWPETWDLKKETIIPCHDISGVVIEVGSEIKKFNVGDEIFGLINFHKNGAEVIALGSTKNKEFIYNLGANKFIDYTKENFENVTKDIDLVLDTVGINVFEKSINVLKNGGRLISIASNSYNEEKKYIEKIKNKNINVNWFIVSPNSKNLEKISNLIDQEIIKVYIDKIIKFNEDEVKNAFLEVQKRHTKGKVVIEI